MAKLGGPVYSKTGKASFLRFFSLSAFSIFIFPVIVFTTSVDAKGPDRDLRLPRPYENAPPTIPHLTTNLKISRSNNPCLECHLKIQLLPPSHFVNKHTGERQKDRIVGIRYNCLQCHLPALKKTFVKEDYEEFRSNYCIECHAGLLDDRLSQPVDLWLASVHAEVGNTCNGCHGGDPKNPTGMAMSAENNFHAAPKKEEVTSFCGKCHQGLSDYFRLSAHWKKGTQNCIGCHGAHTIQRISLEIINREKCSKCHEYETSAELKNILQSLHDRFQASREKIKLISGFPLEPVEKDLDSIWKRVRQVRMISHTSDLTLIRDEAKKVESLLESTDTEIERILDMVEERRLIGYALILTFLLLALLTYFYNRNLEEKD